LVTPLVGAVLDETENDENLISKLGDGEDEEGKNQDFAPSVGGD
jgi:hypothetical protein